MGATFLWPRGSVRDIFFLLLLGAWVPFSWLWNFSFVFFPAGGSSNSGRGYRTGPSHVSVPSVANENDRVVVCDCNQEAYVQTVKKEGANKGWLWRFIASDFTGFWENCHFSFWMLLIWPPAVEMVHNCCLGSAESVCILLCRPPILHVFTAARFFRPLQLFPVVWRRSKFEWWNVSGQQRKQPRIWSRKGFFPGVWDKQVFVQNCWLFFAFKSTLDMVWVVCIKQQCQHCTRSGHSTPVVGYEFHGCFWAERDKVETASWSHVHFVVVIVQDHPPPLGWPPWPSTTLSRDGITWWMVEALGLYANEAWLLQICQ